MLRRYFPLIVILAIAAVARFWAIDFCLPTLTCRPDEEAVASVVTQFFTRDFNPHFFDWPPVFMYAVTLALLPYAKFMKFTGVLRSEYKFLIAISANPTPIVLIARAISALAGTASVALVYRIAAAFADRLTGLVAALLLSLSYLHVRDSHFGVTDVTATLLVLVVVSIAIRMTSIDRGSIAIAAALTGLAAATKYNAVVAGLPVVWMIATATDRSWRDRLMWSALFGALAVATFVAVDPYSVLDRPAFMRSMTAITTHLQGGHGPDLGRGWWVHLASSLRLGVRLPMLIIGIAGLAWLPFKQWRTGIALVLCPVASYAAIGGGLTVFSRYAIPLVPFVCIGAAVVIVDSARAITRLVARPQLSPALAWAVAALVVLPSARATWQFDRLLAIEDSRVAAAHWIVEHYPDGVSIGEAERRFTRLSFHDGTAEQPSRYQTSVLREDVDDPDVIAIVESPLHPAGLPEAIAGTRMARYDKVFETSGPERSGSIYDWQDEFFIPLAGIDRLDRPGPRITLYARR